MCFLRKHVRTQVGSVSSAATSEKLKIKARTVGGRLLVRLVRDEEGQGLIELALSITVIMMMLTGIFSFGVAYSNQQALSQAVGLAGQTISQSGGIAGIDPCAVTFNTLSKSAPQLDPAQIKMTLTLNGVSQGVGVNSCTGVTLLSSSNTTVKATYPCHIGVLGFSAFDCTLTGSVTEWQY